MKAALIGLPLSGKTTLFTAVTGLKAGPGDPLQERRAAVAVPDDRLGFLAKLYNPKKVTPATIEFVDFPGFSLADAHGQEELRRHLPAIRQCDMLVLVVRDFHNPAVPPYRNRVDRSADLAELRDELIFADLDTVAKRLEKLEKSLKKPSKTHEQEKRELALLTSCREALEASRPLSTVINHADDARLLASFAFLTEKKAIVVYNVDDTRAAEPEQQAPEHFHSAVALCADLEAQINDLDPADRPAFLAEMGIAEPARNRLIRDCYAAMDHISFLTMGPDEVRAWPIQRGTTAVDAAGKIHSDLARGFIRAETVAYADLVAAGDFKNAKAAGKVRQEGKAYVVQDGDILNIKFNV
jgi:GTP-binding protein YchF